MSTAEVPADRPAPGGGLDAFFRITERGSTVPREVRAGVTTFMVMAYIIFVNPGILSSGPLEGLGPPFLPTVVATALVAGILTIAMGLVANYPFALAAGLGLNAVVAFQLILGRGFLWQEAMAVIVWEGIIITILVLTGLRKAIMDAIPIDLKRAIAVGIGLFILTIGLVNGGFIQQGIPVVALGNLTTAAFLTFVIGVALALALVSRRVPAALLISILVTTVIAIVLRAVVGEAAGFGPGQAVAPAQYLFDFSAQNFSTIGQPIGYLISIWTKPELAFITVALVVFTLMLSDFFDTMGTVVGVGEQAGLLDKDGQLPGINRVLLVDSLGAVAGGIGSTSSNTTYIESAAGVAEGGRTGLTAVVCGLLFLAAILIAPIAGVVPAQATAAVLVVVGFLMFRTITDIEWGDPDILFPVLVTTIVMPLTYSITDGIAVGFISYTFLKLVRGRAGDIHPLMWVVSAAFVLYFAIPWLQVILGL